MDLDTFLSAADDGLHDVLEEGLSAGLDINAADSRGWTALLTAVRAARSATVLFLLERRADPQARRPGGFGALHLLIQAAKEDGLRPNHMEVAALLLDAGADPNQQNDEGKQSPVRNAAALGMAPLLELFLQSGRANINLRDKQKGTPLLRAAETNNGLTALMLLTAGADATIPDRYGLTPLHMAAASGDLQLVESLLVAGADPEVGTRFPYDRFRARTTALQMAERAGHADVVACLQDPPKQLVERSDPGSWPDVDSNEADWIRDVLQGRVHIDSSRDSYHVLDDLRKLRYDPEQKKRLDVGFRGLLIDADLEVEGGRGL